MMGQAKTLTIFAVYAALTGCVDAPIQQPTETEGGIIETTDEMSIADTGFPVAAVIMTRSVTLDDAAATLRAVQYDTTLATQTMIDAAPAALCAAFDLALVSSRKFAPTSDYIDVADSAVIEAICK